MPYLFFLILPVVAGLLVDFSTNETPKTVLLLDHLKKEITVFFGPVHVGKIVKEEEENYVYKASGTQSTLISAPGQDKQCPDVKLGYCATKALDAHLNEASLLSNRIKKLETQLESVVKRIKLLSEDI